MTAPPTPTIEIDSSEFVTLPISLRAAAGSPIFEPVDLEGRRLAFRRDWLSRASGMAEINEQCCYLAKVDGDSMEPTFTDGAVVLVVRWYPPKRGGNEPIIHDGAMYLIQDGGDGRSVKRLTLDENRKLLLVTSDNPTYPPYTIPLEDRDLRHIILGRVIWSATTHEQAPVVSVKYSEEFGCVMGSITGPLSVQESRQFLAQARIVADAYPECRQILADCRKAEPYVRVSDGAEIATAINDAGFKDWRGAILFSKDRLLIEYVTNAVADCGYSLRAFTDYFDALVWLRKDGRSS